MTYIKLTTEQLERLKKSQKNNNNSRFIKKCQAIILSNKGKQIKNIANDLDISIRTIFRWFKDFEIDNPQSLEHKKGAGRPPILDLDDYYNEIKRYIETHTIKETLNMIFELVGENNIISLATLRRYLKKKDIHIRE